MLDPWAPPTAAQLAQIEAERNHTASGGRAAPWQLPQMSLRSVPDARASVSLLWWVPLVAVLMLGSTMVAILPGTGSGRALLVAIGISIVGYAVVWWRIRPHRVRVGPYAWPSVEGVAQDRTDPPTIVMPAVAAEPTVGRRSLLLLNSAAVGLGATVAWSVVINLLLRPRIPVTFQTRTIFRTVTRALTEAVINAVITSVLEECGIAVLLLAIAGLAERFLSARFDTRSVAVVAILAATVVRTVLHIPLWGVGAVGRIGLSFILAWLFWRTRRIWPLLTVHVLWDTLSLQTLTSPSLLVRGWCALVVLGWGITGVVVVIIAISRSKRNTGRASQYYRRPTSHPLSTK